MWTPETRGRMAKIREKLQRYPDGYDRRRMVGDRAIAAATVAARPSAHDRFTRGGERDPLPGPHRLRLGNAAERFSALADGVLVVPRLRPAVPVQHDP